MSAEETASVTASARVAKRLGWAGPLPAGMGARLAGWLDGTSLDPTGPSVTGDGQLTFVYRGQEPLPEKVAIAGDWTGWQPSVPLDRVGRSPWYRGQVQLPRDAWAVYKLVVDGEWRFDPGNPRRVGAGDGNENSLFTMPGFQPHPDLTPDAGLLAGETVDLGRLAFEGLDGGRRVRVHLPPGYSDKAGPYPLLIVQDGEENISRGRVPEALDLLAQRGYRPVIAAFIDHPGEERHLDYTPFFKRSRLDVYGHFLVDHVLPTLEKSYAVTRAREERVIWGQSFGGTCAAGLFHAWPEVFGRVAAQSGVWLWSDGQDLLHHYADPSLVKGARFYLDSTHFGMEPEQGEAASRALERVEADFVYWRRGTNHSYEGWRFWLPDMLRYLLG